MHMYCSSTNATITFSSFRVLRFVRYQNPKTVIPETIKEALLHNVDTLL
jgi:hypothetical protein